jgi:hypothetical protein
MTESIYMHTYWRISQPGVEHLTEVIEFVLDKECLYWYTVPSGEETQTQHDGYVVLDMMIGGCSETAFDEIRRYAKNMMGIEEHQWYPLPEQIVTILQEDGYQGAGKLRPGDIPLYHKIIFGLLMHAQRNESLRVQRNKL